MVKRKTATGAKVFVISIFVLFHAALLFPRVPAQSLAASVLSSGMADICAHHSCGTENILSGDNYSSGIPAGCSSPCHGYQCDFSACTIKTHSAIAIPDNEMSSGFSDSGQFSIKDIIVSIFRPPKL